MKVVVNKRALKRAINLIVNEERTISSTRIDTIAGKVGQEIEEDTELSPITASEQMATQLTVEAPPVSDPDYIPMSTVELANAAAVISKEVPETQVEYFYRQLHSLLDKVYDKDKENMAGAEDGEMSLDGSEEGMQINESLLTVIARRILKEAEEEGEEAVMTPDEEEELFDKPMGSELKSDITAIDIAQMFIDKGLHWLPLIQDKDSDEGKAGSVATAPAAVPDPVTGDATLGKKNMKVAVNPDEVDKLIMSTIKSDDLIKRKFVRYARENRIDTDVARRNVADALLALLGKRDGAPISLELAAEMHANITSDNAWRAAEADMDEFKKHMQSAIAETKKKDEIEIRPSGAKIQKKIKVQSDMVVHFLEKAIADRIAGNVSDPYDDAEDEDYDMDQSDVPDLISPEQELKNLKKLDGQAPYFGFKNASGLKQWRAKFPDAKYKALIGSMMEIPEYGDYAQVVEDIKSITIDSLADFVELAQASKGYAEAKQSSNEEENAWVEYIDTLSDDFEKIKKHRDDYDNNPEEELDIDLMLHSAAGQLVRQFIGKENLNKEFKNYQNIMEKTISGLLNKVADMENSKLNKKIINSFSQMISGRVNLPELNDDSKNSKKLRTAGVDQPLFNAILKAATNVRKKFFAGAASRALSKKNGISEKLKDNKQLVTAIGIAMDGLKDEITKRDEQDAALANVSTKLDSLTESQINLLIRKLLVR